MKATHDLFLTVDGGVVGEDDPAARFLLVRAGKDIPAEYKAKVKATEPEPEPEVEDVKEADKPVDKQASKAANKSK